MSITLDPATLLNAYAHGIFPMTDDDGIIRWYSADPRGHIPLQHFHIPQTLKPLLKRNHFQIRINTAFSQVMYHCMQTRSYSWINDQLISAYTQLHQLGFAHSVEYWENNTLAGGLYGVSIGGAFFGESMFHLQPNASKIALVHLVNRLNERGYTLLDTQASNPHLKRFGCVDIPASQYMALLRKALQKNCSFQ